MKKENGRMDALSRKSYPKKELFRLVERGGSLVYDPKQNMPGRGYYLHKDAATLDEFEAKGLAKKRWRLPLEEGALRQMRGDL